MTSTPTPSFRRLEGKVALITGGASGIGEASARLFIQHGAKVVIADVQDELGQAICEEFNDSNIISYIHCDVTSDVDVKNAVDTAISRHGKLDIMFNNAGITGSVSEPGILGVSNENFKKVFDVNVFGSLLGAKHAARVMIPARKGCILFTSSLVSVICMDSGARPYTMSKHAVSGFAKSLCVELGEYGIRVNTISPFAIATPMVMEALKTEKKKTEELVSRAAVLKGTVLEVEDIAKAALYLASDDAKYVSGVNLVVDGGFSLINPSFSLAMKSLHSKM